MKNKIKYIFLFFQVFSILIISIIGCQQKKVEDDASEISELNNKLIIYMSAPTHTFRTYDAKGNTIDVNIYPSRHVIGSVISGGDINSPNANIFEKALNEFAKKNNIEVEIHYLEENSGNGDILQNIVNSGEELPDLLLLNRSPVYDYYRLAEQGYLEDLSDLFENMNEIQVKEEYYQTVLEGGKMFGKQYAIPILFNLNGLIVSERYLTSIGQTIPDEPMSYSEILYRLKEGCIAMEDSEMVNAIYETSGYRSNGRYIASILMGAAYAQYFDESSKCLIVSENSVASIFDLMLYYNTQEFASIGGWKNKSYFENINNMYNKSVQLEGLGEIDESIGFFLSGGRSGGVSFYNSLLTDAVYFQTVYKNRGDKLVLQGIPTISDKTTYAANVSLAAYVLNASEKQEEIYSLICFLMDYEFPMQYGFSINKKITEKQLNSIQETVIAVYPHDIWDGVDSIRPKAELEEEIIYTGPLEAEYVEIIRNMLENIEGAGLPYGILEYYMFDSVNNLVGDRELTPEKAGKWVISQWKKYLDIQDTLHPFYDQAYIDSITWIGKIPDSNTNT